MIVDSGNAFVFERISAKITTAGNQLRSRSIDNGQTRESTIPSIPVAFLVVRSADSQGRWGENQIACPPLTSDSLLVPVPLDRPPI